MADSQKTSRFDIRPITVMVVGGLGSVLVALVGNAAVQTVWLGLLLSAVIAILVRRRRPNDDSSIGLLETPFYLSHDAEIFDRYRQMSQQLLRISQRSSKVYRDLALQILDDMTRRCVEMGQGRIVFLETETWRLAYERLLRERKRPGKPFLPGSVVLGPVNSGLWAFSGEVSYERAGAGMA